MECSLKTNYKAEREHSFRSRNDRFEKLKKIGEPTLKNIARWLLGQDTCIESVVLCMVRKLLLSNFLGKLSLGKHIPDVDPRAQYRVTRTKH